MTVVRVLTLPFQNRRGRPVEVLPPVELSTDRLLFRPLATPDRAGVLAALERSRPALDGRFPLNRRGETDHELFTRWVEAAAGGDNNRSAWRRAAFLDDGRFVGVFNLIHIQLGLEWSCEAGWWIDQAHTGRGLGAEGVEAILHFAMAELPVGLGMARVRAMIQPDNAASIRIAEKLGMVSAGHTEMLEIGGVHRPHIVYERTAGRVVSGPGA